MKKCPICKVNVTDKKLAVYCISCRDLMKKIHRGVRRNLSYAIMTGKIQKAEGQVCVDCGGIAVCYDHRDYGQPLQVDPVCKKCNNHRGPAIKFGWRAAAVYRGSA